MPIPAPMTEEEYASLDPLPGEVAQLGMPPEKDIQFGVPMSEEDYASLDALGPPAVEEKPPLPEPVETDTPVFNELLSKGAHGLAEVWQDVPSEEREKLVPHLHEVARKRGGYYLADEDWKDAPDTEKAIMSPIETVFDETIDKDLRLGAALDVARQRYQAEDWHTGDVTGYISKLLPFVGSVFKAEDLYRLRKATKRLEGDGASTADYWTVANAIAGQEYNQRKSGGRQLLDILAHIPAFAAELAVTAGMYPIGKAVATKAVFGTAEAAAKKSMMRYAAEQAVGMVGGTAAVAAMNPQRTAESYARHMVPEFMPVESEQAKNEAKAARLVILDQKDGFENAMKGLIGGYADTMIEIGTELSGAKMAATLSPAKKALAKRLGLSHVKASILKWWTGAAAGRTPSMFAKALKKAQWHGILEEYGEERLGETLRGGLGLEDARRGEGGVLGNLRRKEFAEALNQSMIELGAFSVVGGAASVVDSATDVRQSFKDTSSLRQAISDPEFVEAWGALNPSESSKLALIENPSRSDWKEAGFGPSLSGSERSAFSEALRNVFSRQIDEATNVQEQLPEQGTAEAAPAQEAPEEIEAQPEDVAPEEAVTSEIAPEIEEAPIEPVAIEMPAEAAEPPIIPEVVAEQEGIPPLVQEGEVGETVAAPEQVPVSEEEAHVDADRPWDRLPTAQSKDILRAVVSGAGLEGPPLYRPGTGKRIKQFFRTWLTQHHGRDPRITKIKERSLDKIINEVSQELKFAVSDYDDAVQKWLGMRYVPGGTRESSILDAAMRSKPEALAELPHDLQSSVGHLRNMIDGLAKRMVESNIVPGYVVLRVGEALGEKPPALPDELFDRSVKWNKDTNQLFENFEKENPEFTSEVKKVIQEDGQKRSPHQLRRKAWQNLKKERTAAKVLRDQGVYLHRTYKAIEKPKEWRKELEYGTEGRQAWAAMRQYHKTRMIRRRARKNKGPITVDEIPKDKEVDKELGRMLDYIGRLKKPGAQKPRRGSKLGSKDLTSLKRRKEHALPMREFMGEMKDARANAITSNLLLGQMIASHEFLTEVARNLDHGPNQLFWERNDPNAPPGVVHFGSKEGDNPALRPLDEYDTYPEVRDAFEEMYSSPYFSGPARVYMLWMSRAKAAKTIYRAATQFRNFYANTGFEIANGTVSHVPTLMRALKKATQTTAVKLEPDLPGMKYFNVKSLAGHLSGDRQAIREYAIELAGLGLSQEAIGAREIQDSFRIGMNHTPDQIRDELTEAGLVNRFARGAEALYMEGDSFWKVVAYEVEKARMREAYNSKAYRNAFPNEPLKTEEEIQQEAADYVSNSRPTWRKTSKLVKGIRRSWLFAPFITFYTEVVRGAGHTNSRMLWEFKTPGFRKIAASRLAGQSIMWTVGRGMEVGLGLTAAYGGTVLARGLLGWDGDDEDMEDSDQLDLSQRINGASSLRPFLYDYMKNSNVAVLKDEGRVKHVIDLGFSDPYSVMRHPLQAALREGHTEGRGMAAGAVAGFGELIDPIKSPEILTKPLLEMWLNYDFDTEEKIWTDNAKDNAVIFAKKMAEPVTPGTLTDLARIADPDRNKALEALANFGFRVIKLDIPERHKSISWLLKKEINGQEYAFRRVVRDKASTSEDIIDAYKKMHASRSKTLEKANRISYRAHQVTSGKMTPAEIRENLSKVFGKGRADGILRGQYDAYMPGKSFWSDTLPGQFPEDYRIRQAAILQARIELGYSIPKGY